MSALDEVREEMQGVWARLATFWGVPPAAARVHAWLLSSEDAIEGEVLARELEMSRGAVSMACRELRDWGLVQEERVPGSRKVAYRAETEPERVIRSIVQARKRREWDPLLDNVSRWRHRIRSDRSAQAKHCREVLGEIEGLVGLVDSMAESFLRGGLVQKLGMRTLVSAARKQTKSRAKRNS